MTSQVKIKNYILLEKMGEGKFGQVVKGIHEKTGEEVAIKLERIDSSFKLLAHETTILNLLHSKLCRQIPRVHWFGKHELYNVLVMPCFDMTLYDYIHTRLFSKNSPFDSCMKMFHMMVQIIEKVHLNYVVHCDIKPHNFMLKGNDLVLIDFGFAGFYIDSSGKHRPEPATKKHNLMGTLLYISYNTHLGYEITRRDDIISIFYILLYAVFGGLLWEEINGKRVDTQYEKTHILHPMNQATMQYKSIDNVITWLEYATPLCGNKTHNAKLIEIAKYVYSLSFSEEPDYDYLGV
jgi:casein kinase 1